MTAALTEKSGTDKAGADKTGAERQVVVLHLGADIYGVDIGSIHTVLTPQPITPVPNIAPYILGVMNLRGRVVPVLDLRARFGMPPLDAARREAARIVVVEADGLAAGGATGLAAGLVVDSVSEVLWLSADDIEPPPALLGAAEGQSLTGIGRIPGGRRKGDDPAGDAERLLLLLDIPQVLALAVAPVAA